MSFESSRDADVYPSDTTRGVIDGPEQEHILVLGDRSEISRGLDTNAGSVAAHLATEHHRATEHGACWMVLPVPGDRLGAGSVTAGPNHDLIAGTDLLVLMVGNTDARLLTPLDAWATHLEETLNRILDVLPHDARLVVAEIPRLGGMRAFDRHDRHRRRLNRAMRDLASLTSRVTMAPVSSTFARLLTRPARTAGEFAALYEAWARDIRRSLVSA